MTAVGVSSFLNLVINAAFVLKRRRFITTWYTYYTILATAARPPLGLKKTSSKNKPSNKFYLCLLHLFLLVFFLPFVVFPFLLFSMPCFFTYSFSFFYLSLSFSLFCNFISFFFLFLFLILDAQFYHKQ